MISHKNVYIDTNTDISFHSKEHSQLYIGQTLSFACLVDPITTPEICGVNFLTC